MQYVPWVCVNLTWSLNNNNNIQPYKCIFEIKLTGSLAFSNLFNWLLYQFFSSSAIQTLNLECLIVITIRCERSLKDCNANSMHWCCIYICMNMLRRASKLWIFLWLTHDEVWHISLHERIGTEHFFYHFQVLKRNKKQFGIQVNYGQFR